MAFHRVSRPLLAEADDLRFSQASKESDSKSNSKSKPRPRSKSESAREPKSARDSESKSGSFLRAFGSFRFRSHVQKNEFSSKSLSCEEFPSSTLPPVM